MNYRFYNARVLTMVMDEPIFMGEVWVQDELITYVGKEEKASDGIKWDREIDVKGNLIMPGFKDAHTHSAMTLLRSFADDLPLQDWLEEQVFPVEAKMQDEDIYTLTKLAILEYLTSGITSIFEMYLSPTAIANACRDAGMRVVQVSGINKFGPTLEVMEERFLKLNGQDPLTSYQLGFHAEYTCTKELLESVSAMAHKYQAPVFTHLCETKLETDECIKRYGMTPTAFLDSLGMFDFGGGGYHCVYLSPEDIEIFKKRNLTIVTNPASNAKLASGIAPIKTYVDAGVNVAIGTDGPASNNCLDMFREMFLVAGLTKLKEMDASALDAREILTMATVGGAKAMGLNRCDVLAEGKLADMIMIDLNQPNMQPLNNIEKNIVYSGSKLNVKMTMIHGKILYENEKFYIDETPEDIYRKSNEIASRLLR
ncbi:MAG: amidohydrolase [Clostridia bacterium]|nr:amidohydrolase [Clostridia bacterium]